MVLMPRRNRNAGTCPPDPAWLADQLTELAASLGIPSQPALIPPVPTAKAVTP